MTEKIIDAAFNILYTYITPMGSSRPNSRDGQSSIRKEISRLPEGKRKTIAFYKRWSFLFVGDIHMTNRYSSRISLATLIICLCLGSLAVLPILGVNIPAVLILLETDSENNIPLEQTESEEDFASTSVSCKANANSILSKSRTTDLYFQSAAIASVSPPPKSN